jgi:CDP-glycerol glycerophosphotransferase (TagB/SpsB family)
MKPDSPRVRVVALGDEPVNEMLMRASVLVTDYSSVAWDFHYMKKPVVFFHFDLDKYLNVHGSFINLKKGLFGPHATTADKLVPRIAKAILKPPAVRVDPKNFKYNDRLNCERVYEAIADRFIV